MSLMDVLAKLLDFYEKIVPILDISILAFLFYKAYDFISKTNSMQLLKAAVIVLLAYGIAIFLKLTTIIWIMNFLAPMMLVAFAVIFQPEIRKLFLRLGQDTWSAFGKRSKNTYVDSVLTAAEMLSKQKRGMLTVFIRNTKLDNIVQTGTKLNADLSSSLLVTIFGHDTPLHDGAVIIAANKITAAGCFLPLSEDFNIKKTFGTRHRAALGLSENSDAVVLIVSEETGALSLAYDAKLNYDLTVDEIRKILENLLEIKSDEKQTKEAIDES